MSKIIKEKVHLKAYNKLQLQTHFLSFSMNFRFFVFPIYGFYPSALSQFQIYFSLSPWQSLTGVSQLRDSQ